MRQASLNGHRAAIAHERLSSGEPILDDGEQIVRQVGDTGYGLMLDLAILAKRPAEVRRNVDPAFVCFLISATYTGRLQTEQLELFEVGRQQVTMTFDCGKVVSDAGLLRISKLDQKLGILVGQRQVRWLIRP